MFLAYVGTTSLEATMEPLMEAVCGVRIEKFLFYSLQCNLGFCLLKLFYNFYNRQTLICNFSVVLRSAKAGQLSHSLTKWPGQGLFTFQSFSCSIYKMGIITVSTGQVVSRTRRMSHGNPVPGMCKALLHRTVHKGDKGKGGLSSLPPQEEPWHSLSRQTWQDDSKAASSPTQQPPNRHQPWA